MIDKDTPVKSSPTLVKSMLLSLDVGNANNKSESDSHWLLTYATLTIMDPSQPEPLMQLPISIRHDSTQYRTNVLIDLASTLNFLSHDFLTRNDLLGKCPRGHKNANRIANE